MGVSRVDRVLDTGEAGMGVDGDLGGGVGHPLRPEAVDVVHLFGFVPYNVIIRLNCHPFDSESRSIHLFAARSANSRANCLNRRQLPSLGNSVSSDKERATITGGGKFCVRALAGYIPQKACCRDSRARGIGVARRYISSVSDLIFGMKPS